MVALPEEFYFENGILNIGGVSCEKIALTYGTPIYCYSASAIRRNYRDFSQGIADADICYALKANSCPGVVRLLSLEGCGADVVSGGELKLAISCGIPKNNIVFSGVGKLDNELELAINEGIQINVESLQEFSVISELSKKLNKKAEVAFRFNPDIDALTHKKITTGLKAGKFGLSGDQIISAIKTKTDSVNIVGVSAHIGSQIMDINVFQSLTICVLEFINVLESHGINVKVVDLGGGLGVDISGTGRVPKISDYTREMKDLFDKFAGRRLILEPGRAIVADAGVLLSKVLFVKNDDMHHVIIDAGMNDFIRPAMYDVSADIIKVEEYSGNDRKVVSVCGPVCESGDCFNAEALLPECLRGDTVAICCAGAYGSSMASCYNLRKAVKEVIIENGSVFNADEAFL